VPALPKQPEIKAELDKKIGPLVPGNVRERVVEQAASVVTAVIQQEEFHGPVPHPRHLEAYERICPGSADRLIRMAEDSLAHNIAVSQKQQADDAADRRHGMNLGFGALALLVIGATICGVVGQPELAVGFLATGVVGTVGKFIVGRSSKG
jgi:uncharacterized membrane protein